MGKAGETYLSKMNMNLIKERNELREKAKEQQAKKLLWKMAFVISFGINIGMWI